VSAIAGNSHTVRCAPRSARPAGLRSGRSRSAVARSWACLRISDWHSARPVPCPARIPHGDRWCGWSQSGGLDTTEDAAQLLYRCFPITAHPSTRLPSPAAAERSQMITDSSRDVTDCGRDGGIKPAGLLHVSATPSARPGHRCTCRLPVSLPGPFRRCSVSLRQKGEHGEEPEGEHGEESLGFIDSAHWQARFSCLLAPSWRPERRKHRRQHWDRRHPAESALAIPA
jgi:hypothetical protein